MSNNVSMPELHSDELALWESIVSKTAETFRLNDSEADSLRKNELVRMFALLPYFAECPNHEGIGLLNVSIYITERVGGREFFIHHEGHDLEYLRRFQPFRDVMAGGKEEVIEKGLALAGLVMLNDYLQDQEEDVARGKYNPLNEGSWDYDSARQALEGKAQALPVQRMDKLFSLAIIRAWCWHFL